MTQGQADNLTVIVGDSVAWRQYNGDSLSIWGYLRDGDSW